MSFMFGSRTKRNCNDVLNRFSFFRAFVYIDVFTAHKRADHAIRIFNLKKGWSSKLEQVYGGHLHGRREIQVPGGSWKADHLSAICFLYSVNF